MIKPYGHPLPILHCSILRKLVTMISEQAHLEAEGQAARKQAESATATAKALLEQGDEGKVRVQWVKRRTLG